MDSAYSPDRKIHFKCNGNCGNEFDLEGYGSTSADGIKSPPLLDVRIEGHIEPAPQGCLMPLGWDWMLYWLGRPAKSDPNAAPNPNAIAERKQVFGPIALCRKCMAEGGIAILPDLVKLMWGGKVSFGPQTLLEILNLITMRAREKNTRRARRPK